MNNDDPDDDYLFDGSGPPDPDVERLERLLRPLGHHSRTPAATGAAAVESAPPPRVRRAKARPLRTLVFATLVVAAAVLLVSLFPADVTDPPSPPVREGAGGQGRWVVTTDESREIRLGDLIDVTVKPRTRLQVRSDEVDDKLLYLARGSIEARVSADARPRFFQVETDAVRCVDLGCRFTLDVDDAGVATVRVLTGQVAFETPTREVFVPAGATAAARKGRGPGTPRFEDAQADVGRAFDAFDAAPPERRRSAAEAAIETVRGPQDTLAAWHLLQEDDDVITRAATARLELVAGPCDVSHDGTPAGLRAAWKEYLIDRCW